MVKLCRKTLGLGTTTPPTPTTIITITIIIACICVPTCVAGRNDSGRNSSQCRPNADYKSVSGVALEPSLQKHEAGLLLLLGFGGFSVFLAVVYNLIRRFVYNDVNNVDSTFDAGGNVSSSLTAVTIAAQLLWPADLMQSVTFGVKFGIAGAFWYCGACMLNLSIFPLLSFKFKTKAPGAKTYLQIILARFGRPAHIVFCVFALLLNTVIISTILIGGIAVMQATIHDVSPEFCLLAIITLCGSYSLIGGLGSTFYVSYFNAFMTFVVLTILIVKIIYLGDEPFGSLAEIYERVNCVQEVPGNLGGSRFTFLSESATVVCVQSIFLVASITYCDQASWQSRIAAKPLQGAIGFLFGAFVWFAVPASIGLVTGLTYLAESAIDANATLSLEQIDSGIVSTYMAQKALGTGGVIMMLTMITMLTMSTGSGEIMAVSAIVIYDIYQTYINPFRKSLPHTKCILCGKTKPRQEKLNYYSVSMQNKDEGPGHVCTCPPVATCQECKEDVDNMGNASRFPGRVVIYKCSGHNAYRTYQDSLINFKNWCMLWVSIGLIPFGLVLYEVGIDLNWLMLVGCIITVPSFPGVVLSVLWVKATSKGLITGSVVGFCSGIATNILIAYFEYHGEGGFIRATSNLYCVLGGSTVGGSLSLILTIVVSLCTHEIETKEDEDDVWERMRNIDNPLHPWSENFINIFPESSDGTTRPTQEQLEFFGRSGRLCSIVGSIVFFIIFLVIIPSAMSSLKVLSSEEFQAWTMFVTIWLIIAASVIILVTPVEEVYHIVGTILKKSKQKKTHQNSILLSGNKKDFKTTHYADNNSDLSVERASEQNQNKVYQRVNASVEDSDTPL